MYEPMLTSETCGFGLACRVANILQDVTVVQEASMDNDEGRENQQEEVDEEEETWDDWQAEGGEDDNDERTKCLFCDEKVTGQRSLLSV